MWSSGSIDTSSYVKNREGSLMDHLEKKNREQKTRQLSTSIITLNGEVSKKMKL